MAAYFLDTSALVKLYVREPGSNLLLELANSPHNRLLISSLAAVEFTAAVHSAERSGRITISGGAELIASFRHDLSSRLIRRMITDSVLDNAVALTGYYPLRAYDAVQLATALAVAESGESSVFVCSDINLLRAASAEGLSCVNPQDEDS